MAINNKYNQKQRLWSRRRGDIHTYDLYCSRHDRLNLNNHSYRGMLINLCNKKIAELNYIMPRCGEHKNGRTKL